MNCRMGRPRGPEQGFRMINIKKALKNGLTFPPFPRQQGDSRMVKKLPEERQAKLRSGMTD